MSLTVTSSVHFGALKSGLATVGYTLLDAACAAVGGRVTAGVVAIGGGEYGATITLPDATPVRHVRWDTGEATPRTATDRVAEQVLLAVAAATPPTTPELPSVEIDHQVVDVS